jgi:protein O-mannosyl-transferase
MGQMSARSKRRTARPSAPPPAHTEAPWRNARWAIWLAAGLIVLATIVVYSNSFTGPLILDDLDSISDNPTIRRLWPIGPVLSPPPNGETVSGRPLLNLSLAINYAVGGTAVRGYHATNLAIHVLAALLLFGIVRRTLLLPAMHQRWGPASTSLALAVALIWAVHPLQTESVTYIVQRAESLAALFYLLTLYCVVRGARSGKSVAWYAAAVLSCLLGMATKEVMVSAPVVVLLYDRTFLAGSFAEAWRRRWGVYAGLAATWGLLAYLVVSTGLVVRPTEFGGPGRWSYAFSQPGVVLHYLRLSVWPHPLCLDYAWPVARTLGGKLPALLVVGLLFAATVWGLVRRSPLGFLGAWFFLILAPSSSIMPLNQLAFEHRMYLPLAAVAATVVLSGSATWWPWGRRQPHRHPWLEICGGLLVATACVVLGWLTYGRNIDYQEEVSIWEQTVAHAPNSANAQNSLGVALGGRRQIGEAIAHFQKALEIRPDFAGPHYNLGYALAGRGQIDEASAHYQKALEIDPNYARAYNNLAWIRATHPDPKFRDGALAVKLARRAAELTPDSPDILDTLAAAYAEAGRFPDAVQTAHKALELAAQQDKPVLAETLQARIASYEAGKPCREPPHPYDNPE